MHYFGYRRVKYLDDGRDYVSFMEFLAIHVTFSVLSCWMTYFVTYNLFSLIKIVEEYTDVNLALETVSIIAMVIQMFECTVYLAYYKDVIFASVTLLNYIGMYMHNYEGKKDLNTLSDVVHCQLTLILMTIAFIIVTILHDFDKAFYQQYRKFYSQFEQAQSQSENEKAAGVRS